MTDSMEVKQNVQTTEAPKPSYPKKTWGFPRSLVYVCGVIALLLIGFISGRASERGSVRHALLWQNNYRANFFDDFGSRNMRGGMMNNFASMPMRSHGFLGTVISVSDENISVQSNDGIEQSVQITDQTIIRRNRDKVEITDLKNGERVAIFGQPNNKGQVAAVLIRIFE